MNLQQIGQLILQLLQTFAGWVNQQAVIGAEDVARIFIVWIQGLNFIVDTPLAYVTVLERYIGLNQIVPLLDAATGTAMLFAAIHYAGHHWLGWPGLSESVTRIGVGVMLVKMSQQLTDWSLQLATDLAHGVAASLPTYPNFLGTGNVFVVVILLLVWAWQLVRLAFAAGQRIAWLALLKPIAGLAFITFMFSKAWWIGSVWVRLWVGYLVGAFLLMLCLTESVLFVNVGGFGGYVLSVCALMVARKALELLTPSGGVPLVSVGPIKFG